MPVLKFDQCDYDCHDKQNKRGSFRVYCRRVDPKCGVSRTTELEPKAPQEVTAPKFPYPPGPLPHLPEKIKNLAADIRIVIGNQKASGESLDNIRHIFKERKLADIMQAFNFLLADKQLVEIEKERYIVSDPFIIVMRSFGPYPPEYTYDFMNAALKHGLRINDIPLTAQIAKGVMKVDKASSLEAQHISEAVQYAMPNYQQEVATPSVNRRGKPATGPGSPVYERMKQVLQAAKLPIP